MYYQGTPDAAKAELIVLKPGEEASFDRNPYAPGASSPNTWSPYNQITHKPGQGIGLVLIPKTDSQQWEFAAQGIAQKADGSFEIREVLQGSYVLAAYWFDEGKLYITRQPVEVGDGDVEGIAMAIAPGVVIGGRIVWDGKPSLEKDELTRGPRVCRYVSRLTFGPSRVDTSNVFSLKNMSEGPYRVEVIGQSKDCYIKEVRYGESSALQDGFVVCVASRRAWK